MSRRASVSVLVLALTLAPASGYSGEPAAAPSVGKPLDVKLERLSGEKIKLSVFAGQPLLLELWATWCAPCRRQSEIVAGLADELAARDVAVLAVNEGEATGPVERFVASHAGPFPVVLDRRQVVATRLDIGELPALVLLDESGRVVGSRSGLIERDELLLLLATLGAAPAAD